MPDCPSSTSLQAFHDGQLSAGGLRETEQHVSACATCAAEVGRLRDLSQTLHAVRFEPIRPDELARLHEAIGAVQTQEDRGILRFAVGWSAVAASILIISAAWLYDAPASGRAPIVAPSRLASTPEIWERVASGGTAAAPQDATPSGTAMRDTTDWMIGGTKDEGGHGNP